jgi:hypothetical protein
MAIGKVITGGGGVDVELNSWNYMPTYALNQSVDQIFSVNQFNLQTDGVVSGYASDSSPDGLGCMGNQLFMSGSGIDTIRELNPLTLAIINTGPDLNLNARGAGGNLNRVYSAWDDNKIREHNPATLAVIDTSPVLFTTLQGVGGMEDEMFYVDDGINTIGEIALNLNSIIRSASAGTTTPRTVGGTLDKLFGNGVTNSDTNVEYNPATFAIIATYNAPGFFYNGIGGFKIPIVEENITFNELLDGAIAVTKISYNNEEYTIVK